MRRSEEQLYLKHPSGPGASCEKIAQRTSNQDFRHRDIEHYLLVITYPHHTGHLPHSVNLSYHDMFRPDHLYPTITKIIGFDHARHKRICNACDFNNGQGDNGSVSFSYKY